MGEGDGIRESSEAVSQPPGAPAGAASRSVFLSYASPDVGVASQVCQFLESHGVPCWMAPRDVKPGAAYADAIVRAINEASALVLVLSASAMASEHVSREVERAASKHKPVVAFRVDAAKLSAELEYFLSRSQWIDVPTLGMPGASVKLAEAVRQGAASAQPNPGLGGGDAAGRASINQAVGAASVAKRVVLAAAAVVVVLGIGGVLAVRFWQSKHGDAQAPAVAAISDKSIAVLPFVDMSEKHDQEYFSDGLSEELIDMLTKVAEIHVPARTSSFFFKGKQTTIAEIAKALGVAHVLEGSVRKSGNTIRITAQLIRVENGYHVWSETFDRQLDDIFKIQDEIAGAVVKALKVSLLTAETTRAKPTTSIEAYTLYLQARSITEGRAATVDYDAAMGYLQHAVTLDPNFAGAWALLGSILVDSASWHSSSRPIEEVRAEARRAADRALALDPQLSDGHLAMGKYFQFLSADWGWNEAEVEFNRALDLDPGNTDALRFKSYLDSTLHRFDEEFQLAQRAVAHDPLNAWNYHALAVAQGANGRFSEAEAAYRKALELNPTGAGLHALLGDVLLAKGEPKAALTEMERETDDEWRQSSVPFALDALGRKSEADAEIAKLEEKSAVQAAFVLAEFYACRKDVDRAILWLGRGSEQLGVDPVSTNRFCMKNLEPDPRYKALLHKMNLPE